MRSQKPSCIAEGIERIGRHQAAGVGEARYFAERTAVGPRARRPSR